MTKSWTIFPRCLEHELAKRYTTDLLRQMKDIYDTFRNNNLSSLEVFQKAVDCRLRVVLSTEIERTLEIEPYK